MSAGGKMICQAGRDGNEALRLYTARTQNWNSYSLQSHCRIEYPDGVVFEETCVEYCCPASSWGENLGSALEG